MKKTYIQPAVYVKRIESEPLMSTSLTGIDNAPLFGGDADGDDEVAVKGYRGSDDWDW